MHRERPAVFTYTKSLEDPSWAFNGSHRARAAFDPSAAASPFFSVAEMDAQRAAANALVVSMTAAIARREALFTVPPGNYRFSAQVTIDHAAGTKLVGTGATFWFHSPDPAKPPAFGVVLNACSGLTLDGVTIDCFPHMAVQATVTSVDRVTNRVDIRAFAGAGFPAFTSAALSVPFVVFAPDGEMRGTCASAPVVTHCTATTASLDAKALVAVGDHLAFPQALGWSNPAALTLNECSSTIVKNVTVSGSAARGIFERFGSAGTYAHCRIGRAAGTSRLLSCATEGFVSVGQSVGPVVDACGFGDVGGGGVKVNGFFGVVVGTTADMPLLHIAHIQGVAAFRTGTSATFYMHHNRTLGTAGVVSCAANPAFTPAMVAAALTKISPTMAAQLSTLPVVTVHLAEDVTPMAVGVFVDTGSACGTGTTIRESYIHDSVGGVILAGPKKAVVTHTAFVNTDTVFLGADATTLTGPFCSNVTFDRNFLRRGRLAVGSRTLASKRIHALTPPPMSNITITNNVVCSAAAGPGITVTYASGAVVKNNVVAPASFPVDEGDGAWEFPYSDGAASSVRTAIFVTSGVAATDNMAAGPVEGLAAQYIDPEIPMSRPRVRYSIDDPPGPGMAFSAADIARQVAEGQTLFNRIRSAAANLSVSDFVIPPGNYGFRAGFENRGTTIEEFHLKHIARPDDNPFTIRGNKQATFWYVPDSNPKNMGAVSSAVLLQTCSNIRFDGLTIDKYPHTCGWNIDGKVTRIDVPNNRIEMRLVGDSFSNVSQIANLNHYPSTPSREGFGQCRVVPVKPDGAFTSGVYSIAGIVVEPTCVLDIAVSPNGPDTYWLNLRFDNQWLDTIYTPPWLNAYGPEGTLEVGDGLVFVMKWTNAFAFEYCKNIHVSNCTMHTGMLVEMGGYGNHKYTDLYFGRRPGTNRILGGNGHLGGKMRHGSVWDRCYFGLTVDDAINTCGLFGSFVTAVSGNSVTINMSASALQAGDTLEFWDITTGALERVFTVREVHTPPSEGYGVTMKALVTLTESPTLAGDLVARTAPVGGTLRINFPSANCQNWAIRNCEFEGNYQRLLLQTGPGVFENNIVHNMGSSLLPSTAWIGNGEGGFAHDITVQNNAFLHGSTYAWGQHDIGAAVCNYAQGPLKTRRLVVTNNVFVGTGGPAIIAKNTVDSVVANNVFVDCLVTTALARPTTSRPTSIIVSGGAGTTRPFTPPAANLHVLDNIVIERQVVTDGFRVSDPLSYADGSRILRNVARLDAGMKVARAIDAEYRRPGANALTIVAVAKSASL